VIEETDDGVIIGGEPRGFVRNQDGTITSIEVPGAESSEAPAINSVGQIVGAYLHGNAYHGFLRDKHGTLTLFDVSGSATTY
jgi:uncharacterized membrane protein